MDLGKTIPDEQQQALLFDCVGSFQLESPNQTKERNHNNGAIEMRKEVWLEIRKMAETNSNPFWNSF